MSSFWNNEYEIGIEEIDKDHRQLAERLQVIKHAVEIHRPRQEIGDLLADFLTATQVHFRNEEELMSEGNYAGLKDHQREHLDLLQRFMAYKEHFDTSITVMSASAIKYLERWLLTHIEDSDRKFGQARKASQV